MSGIYVTFKDGIIAYVPEIHILETYSGQLAGTMTIGTRFRLPAIEGLMEELKAGNRTGYYYPTPELIDEVDLRGISQQEAELIRSHTELGQCLKEEHLVIELHVSDPDYCNILELHVFLTGKEMQEKPLTVLIQDTVHQLSYHTIKPFFKRIDWMEMY